MVNFISELQEQMCRFQKEINSKIREKKALQTLADGSLDHELPTEAGEGQASHAGTSCDGTREPVHGREEGPVEKGWREDSSEAEQQDDSVGVPAGVTCGGLSIARLDPVCCAESAQERTELSTD